MAKVAATIWTLVKIVVALFVLAFVYQCTKRMDHITPAVLETARQPCSASNFAVTTPSFSKREHSRLLSFTASVTNSGTTPCGVQLKIVTFDKAGAALRSDDFWPASTRNIMPGATEHFTYHVDFDRAAKTYQLQVINASKW